MSGTSACGILFCFNEEHIIGHTIKYYLEQGIDLVVVDNQSTDSTMSIIDGFRNGRARYDGKIRDLVHIETHGYEWQRILQFACRHMHRELADYDWILLIDADAFYGSPVKNTTLLEYMGFVGRLGFNAIAGRLYTFYPTEEDDRMVLNPIDRMKFYKPGLRNCRRLRQEKIFRYHPTVDFFTTHGHKLIRDNPRVFYLVPFIYKHYAWTSYQHGLKKIFKDRLPRLVDRRTNPNDHIQYLGLLPSERDLVLSSRGLLRWKEHKMLISYFRFCMTTKCRVLVYPINRVAAALVTGSSIHDIIHDGLGHIKGMPLVTSAPRQVRQILSDLASPLLPNTEPYSIDFPIAYHFLMTNQCNARCVFCNQRFDVQRKAEITLDGFGRMLSNIPTGSAKQFYFSGGGEPFLCRDLFGIIRHVNTRFPYIDVHIRTNGLLIGQNAEDLATLNRCHLEVSVHGMPDANDLIIQTKGSQRIFEGIDILNRHLKLNKVVIKKEFFVVVSRSNIYEVPKLIRQAAELGVSKVTLVPLQYPAHRIASMRLEDSIVFHQQLYQDVVRESSRLARRLGVGLEAPSASVGYFKKVQKRCRVPWAMMVVDWDGTVYPCPGWEVILREKVQSGECDFGNLSETHVADFWNNESWTKIRRTRLSKGDEEFMPECVNCPHNPYSLSLGPSKEKITISSGHGISEST